MTAKTQATPEEHSSVVGGSTAARRIGCPRSLALEAIAPPDTGSIYAREGTALHEMIAIVLRDEREPEDLLPFTFKREGDDAEGSWEFTVDQDLWYDLGEPALAAFDRFVADIEKETGDVMEFVTEERCAMPGIPNAFGTSDVIWRCGDLSGIWDWKFGRTPVSAEENKQLMFYARAAASTLPHLFGPIDGVEGNDTASSYEQIDPKREVILSIMQPKAGDEPSEYICTVEELEAFRVKLMAAIQQAQAEGLKAPVAKGKWCDFAPCKNVCPLWAGRSAEFGQKMAALSEMRDDALRAASAGDVVAADQGEAEADDAFTAMLPELLDLAEAARDWASTLFKTARAMLASGDKVEGWKLKDKREFAVPEEEVKKFLKNRRYKLDDYMPRKMLTMLQTEALLKRDGRTIPEEMVRQKPSSDATLVRADHPAPAAQMSSDKAKALGDKLAALRGETTEA